MPLVAVLPEKVGDGALDEEDQKGEQRPPELPAREPEHPAHEIVDQGGGVEAEEHDEHGEGEDAAPHASQELLGRHLQVHLMSIPMCTEMAKPPKKRRRKSATQRYGCLLIQSRAASTSSGTA